MFFKLDGTSTGRGDELEGHGRTMKARQERAATSIYNRGIFSLNRIKCDSIFAWWLPLNVYLKLQRVNHWAPLQQETPPYTGSVRRLLWRSLTISHCQARKRFRQEKDWTLTFSSSKSKSLCRKTQIFLINPNCFFKSCIVLFWAQMWKPKDEMSRSSWHSFTV